MDFRMNGRMALNASVHPGVARKNGIALVALHSDY